MYQRIKKVKWQLDKVKPMAEMNEKSLLEGRAARLAG